MSHDNSNGTKPNPSQTTIVKSKSNITNNRMSHDNSNGTKPNLPPVGKAQGAPLKGVDIKSGKN